MNKQPQTCYVLVSTENELPKIGVKVICLNSDLWVTRGRVRDTESKYKWSVDTAIGMGLHNSTPTHWLKERSVYIHTPEELAVAFREKAEKVWDAAILSSLPIGEPLDTDEAYKNYVRKQQYLDQHYPLLNQ